MARAWRFELVCRRASASSRVRRRWATFPSSRRCVLASPSRVPPRWWIRSKFHPTGRPLRFLGASTVNRRPRARLRSRQISRVDPASTLARVVEVISDRLRARGRRATRAIAPHPGVGAIDRALAWAPSTTRVFSLDARTRALSRSRRGLVAISSPRRAALRRVLPLPFVRAHRRSRVLLPGRSPRAGWSGRGRESRGGGPLF